jgi:regulator of vacuolar morphogenesis
VDTDETRNLDNRGIYEMNDTKLKKQNELLEMIGNTADRLNEIGQTIGREVHEQTPLIGKLAGGVDSGTDRINKATRQVKAQSDAGATPWCLW